MDTVETVNPASTTAELDRLGDEIAELSAHLEAATARLLTLIREFDARGGWSNDFRSCAHWLSWRVGLDMGAAREKVRVARALGTLPRLAQALACGELSYAKVRALTRVATPETEQGGPTTLSNLAMLCRRHHRAVHEEGHQVDRDPDGALRFFRPDGDPVPEVPRPPKLPTDPVNVLRAKNHAAAVDVHSPKPLWFGQSLDVGYAIDVLHPRARPRDTSEDC